MEKSVQTDKQKYKMPAQLKSLSQKEFLLPVLEGKSALLLLDKDQKVVFTWVFLL